MRITHRHRSSFSLTLTETIIELSDDAIDPLLTSYIYIESYKKFNTHKLADPEYGDLINCKRISLSADDAIRLISLAKKVVITVPSKWADQSGICDGWSTDLKIEFGYSEITAHWFCQTQPEWIGVNELEDEIRALSSLAGQESVRRSNPKALPADEEMMLEIPSFLMLGPQKL